MSKLEAQRAMRAARYDAARAASSARPSTRPAGAAGEPPAPPTRARAKGTAVAPPPDEADPGLCGHRSMAGKMCKRPAGHPETNHRYT